MKQNLAHWGRGFFREEIFSPDGSEHLAAAPHEADAVRRRLKLHKGARLLDLCCGTGRHSIPFARRGLDVVGLDITAAYLKKARRRAGNRKNLRFIQSDMRALAFTEEFDAVVNLWTSFGYFVRLADDRKVLRGIYRALKPGGRFLVELINADYLRAHGMERYWHRRADGAYCMTDFKMKEGRDPHHTNTWTVLKPGGRPHHATFFVRSYNKKRLTQSLTDAGLRPEGCWGSLDGKAFHPSGSPRLILSARRPLR